MRIDLRVVLLRFFDLPLDLANGREILIQLALVGRTQIRLQLPGVVGDEIEDAPPEPALPRPRLWAQRHAAAEQPLEKSARVENRRQRLGLAPPRQVIGVSAGVAGIAIARLP